MKVWLVLGLLLLATWQTQHQIQPFRCNRCLWQHASLASPTVPQARVNLAATYIEAREFAAAEPIDRAALQLAEGRPDEYLIRQFVGVHLRWMSVFTGLCDRPAWRSACSFS